MKKTNNEIIKYKENIFFKIKNFLKNIFKSKLYNQIKDKEIEQKENRELKSNSYFKEKIILKDKLEKQMILQLKEKYDNGEIHEDELTLEDMNLLINLYEEETKKINEDTEYRKERIRRMLNEMRGISHI